MVVSLKILKITSAAKWQSKNYRLIPLLTHLSFHRTIPLMLLLLTLLLSALACVDTFSETSDDSISASEIAVLALLTNIMGIYACTILCFC
jgi:hypothetical protein